MDSFLLNDLYMSRFGKVPSRVLKIAGAGSNRRYYRLYDDSGASVVGVVGNDSCENRSFVRMSEVFRAENFPMPEVYCCSNDMKCYLQQDLGDVSLFSLLGADDSADYVSMTLESLARLQQVRRMNYDFCYPAREFDRRGIMWDLNYFKYCFLKPSGIECDENLLEDDFQLFASKLLLFPKNLWGFMYRDCQSRNVMIYDNKPYWIDFQGGRRGPVVYDLASFLWQAKAGFSDDFRSKMIEVYIKEFEKFHPGEGKTIKDRLPEFVFFRTLQVLGAYGFRGLIEKKAHFVESIPQAIGNLRSLLDKGLAASYPELEKVLYKLVEHPRYSTRKQSDRLTVSVFSFSYKKGYPDDFSGNGGGFVFDCRAMHNPGRYAEFKSKTGLDSEVIEFLERRGEVKAFLKNVRELTDTAIKRYIERGFTGLQIAFGCTGGQHRSVYCAESTANHIAGCFPNVVIRLEHREQRIIRDIIGEDLK